MELEIVAEVAQGYEGSERQAILMLRAAAAAGADAVKFQLIYADELASPDYEHYKLFQSLEMPDESWQKISSYSKKLSLDLHLDIFGHRGLILAEKLQLSAIKVHSTDIVNIGLIEAISRSSVPKIVLGAGGALKCEIEEALEILRNKNVVILYGFQAYPTEHQDAQVARVMQSQVEWCTKYQNVTYGYADHAFHDDLMRYSLAACAVGAGATYLEKHITLGRIMKLEDYESALNPDEFFEFVQTLKSTKLALGHIKIGHDFDMSDAEKRYRVNVRRHVVASQDLSASSHISINDLILKRTSNKSAIFDLNLVYGRRLKRDVKKDDPLLESDF